MTQVAFDTMTTTQILEDSGMVKTHAQAITIAIKKEMEGEFATKTDNIANLKSDLSQAIAKSDKQFAELSHSISLTNNSLMALTKVVDKMEKRLDKHDERFDKIDARFDKIDARFDKIDGRFDKQDGRFDKQDARFDKQDARFDKIDQRNESLSKEVTSISNEVSRIKIHFGVLYAMNAAIFGLLVLPLIERFISS